MQRPIGGYDNIPGAPGNTYGNLTGNPFGAGFVIPKGKASGQPVMPEENPADINSVYGRPGLQPMPTPMQPRLPMAFGGDNFNLNTLLAQASPGGQNIGNVGGMLGGEIAVPAPNVFSMRPRIGYNEQGLDVGGSMNIPIGKDGRVQLTGGYRPDSSELKLKGTIGQPPGSQGLGIDFYVNKLLNKKNDIGVEARYSTQF